MVKKNEIIVKDVSIKTMTINGVDYICITDIAKQKNAAEPKDVVKNWMRQKNTLEYLGLWDFYQIYATSRWKSLRTLHHKI